MIIDVRSLPGKHLFASMVHERSRVAAGGGLHMLDRREGGVSHVTASRDGLIVSTDDRLDIEAGPLTSEVIDWLTCAEAPPLPDGDLPIRSFERRAWIAAKGRESRAIQRMTVVPGVGITDSSAYPPEARTGYRLGGHEPLVFRDGSSATLMHELAGHRSESRAEIAAWPGWLSIVDDPRITPWAACIPDDTGSLPRSVDLRSGPPASWRRFRVIDAPQRRMSTVVVSCDRTAPWSIPDRYIEVSLVGRGAYDPVRDVVSFSIFSGALVEDGVRLPLEQPQSVELSATELLDRIAGARGAPVAAPGVVCGAHGSELPVGSIGCELFLRSV